MIKAMMAFAVVALSLGAMAMAQSAAVEHQVKGPADKEIQIGAYINIKPDCTSGPLPTIRLVRSPEHGKVSVKKVSVNATNYKQCLALETSGFVAFYRSVPGFAGTDLVILEVRFPGGRIELQKITVTVAGTSFRAYHDACSL